MQCVRMAVQQLHRPLALMTILMITWEICNQSAISLLKQHATFVRECGMVQHAVLILTSTAAAGLLHMHDIFQTGGQHRQTATSRGRRRTHQYSH
eukprot:19238-Heterococcus_DN1.PRE.1